MIYRLFFEKPNRHKIRIELEVPASGDHPVTVCQSTWRPGRYELAPYAERLSDVRAFTRTGKNLRVARKGTHQWEIEPTGDDPAIFEYHYYATVRDAGNSRFDDSQIYINGVNLFLYFPDQIDQPCAFTLNCPDHYRIACGLPQQGKVFTAADYHQLVDAPLFASPTLQELRYDLDGIPFHIWFQGNCSPNADQFEQDFRRFSKAQLALFGGFPSDQYHFLFQIRPDSFYHGVEHFNSTVIAIGPGSQLMGDEIYTEVLGVSSHELFHTWNVKAIRPADMLPYRYDGPNYCKMHYVTEGVTTYYGDLMLLKSGVWDLAKYLEVMNAALPGRYYKNDGRKYIALEQASFDSWVNGYKDAVPNRKISFYTKGALVAFIADVRIRQATGNERSLDTVMRLLWERFGKMGRGYTREDYQQLLEEVSGQSFAAYFQDCIAGTTPLEPMLAECAHYLGLEYVQGLWPSRAARYCGMLLEIRDAELAVSQLFEDGPAENAGLYKEDIVRKINGKGINPGNFAETMDAAAASGQIIVQIVRDLEEMEIIIPILPSYICPWYQFVEMENASEVQLSNRAAWASLQ